MKVDFETVVDLIDKYHLNITPTVLDGENFLIFDGNDDIAILLARLNGFDGPLAHVYVPHKVSVADAIQICQDELLKDPENQGLKRQRKDLTNLLLYEQHLALRDEIIEECDFDGFEYGFSDEYTTCIECGNSLRIAPDSYSWTQPLWLNDEGYVCDECADSGRFDEQILEEYRSVERSIPECIDLSRLKLVKVNDESFQNGFYEHMKDEPGAIIKPLSENGIGCWFTVYPSQFHCSFDVLVQEDKVLEARKILKQLFVDERKWK